MKLKLLLSLAALTIMVGGSALAIPKSEDKIVVLTDKNTLVLNGEVDDQTVGELISKARSLDDAGLGSFVGLKSKEPIYLILYTPGGSIQKGLELMEALKGLGRPIRTITIFAASMGFQIVQGMDERYILRNGVLMSHHAAGQMEGEFGGNEPSQMSNRQGLWMKRIEEMDRQTVDRTKGKQTLQSYRNAYDHELWRTGEDSVSEGYADKVVKVKCDSSLSGVVTHEVTVNFLGIPIPVEYDLDACPLNTAPMNVRIKIDTTQGEKDSKQFVQQGGAFGPACLQDAGKNVSRLCALDTSLTADKIENVKKAFVERFTNIQNHIIGMKP
jgi:ATP-dependent protease ClpP protease subunit